MEIPRAGADAERLGYSLFASPAGCGLGGALPAGVAVRFVQRLLAAGRRDEAEAAISRVVTSGARWNHLAALPALRSLGDFSRVPVADWGFDTPPAEGFEILAAAFLAGIALEAGKSLVLDRDAVRAEADRLGLFVVGVQP